MITPTIGRVVWYTPHESEGLTDDKSQPLAAMVCYVHNQELVNLVVHDANGHSYSKTSITLFQGDATECPAGSCCWMPYQQAQAKKEAA